MRSPMGMGQNLPVAGISLAAGTFVAMMLLGVDPVIAIAVTVVWIGSLMVIAGRPPEPAPVVRRQPLSLESIRDLIENFSTPLLITDRSTIALANSAARTMLGQHMIGQDARVALRQPEAIALLNEGRNGEAIVRGLVRRQDIWQISRRAIDDRLALLELTNQTAEADISRAHTDFVANASHELRTPLAAIRAQAQVLRRLAPQGLGEDADRLVAMVDRANALIDGMLTLARLNATAVTARSVDVHALVAEVLAEAFVDLPEEAMELSVIPDHIVRWRCDPSLLQIALSAVIGNALRHARAGGRLDVAIMRASDRLVVTIGDRGSGVPSAERERLLRRFEHGASASSGSGLGLSIASKAMSLLAGSIRLEDRTDGPGLLVILTLPSPTD